MPEYLVHVDIIGALDKSEDRTHARMITAHSLDDAARRVVAAMKLINEPKEGDDENSANIH